MKSLLILLVMVPAISLLGSCSRKTQKTMEINDPEVNTILQAPLPDRNLHFAFDLLKVLPQYEDNFVVSPFSISTALAMTYAGAREETQRQMIKTLYFDPDQSGFHSEYKGYLTQLNEMAADKIQLNIANSIWAQQDYHFQQDFFDLIENNYNSELQNVDFTTNREAIRQDINQWVEEETREKIKDLIAPGVFTEDTRMVLVNAIHFFGPWQVEFDKKLTRQDYFNTLDGQQKTTDFMYRNQKLPYFEDETMQVIELPYAGETFSMVIMLPKEGFQLKKFEEKLNAEMFLDIMKKMEVPSLEMDILIPRFKAETKTDLERTLSDMGMPMAFGNQADFSGMTGERDLKIDKVIHKAMIDVAEEGTEAAAATAVVIVRKTSIDPQEKILFKADKPFLFFIKDNRYNSVLFLGRMNNPEKVGS